MNVLLVTPHSNTSGIQLKLVLVGSCAKHSTEMAEVIVEAELFPLVLIHLAHSCTLVAKNAACLVRDVVKHSLELAQLVANTGGVGALLEVIQHTDGDCRIPSITALGYMAGKGIVAQKSLRTSWTLFITTYSFFCISIFFVESDRRVTLRR